MFLTNVLGLFLYFPEDKTEYIPAVIQLVLITVLAYFAVRFFMKLSKKEEQKSKELEEKINMTMEDKNS